MCTGRQASRQLYTESVWECGSVGANTREQTTSIKLPVSLCRTHLHLSHSPASLTPFSHPASHASIPPSLPLSLTHSFPAYSSSHTPPHSYSHLSCTASSCWLIRSSSSSLSLTASTRAPLSSAATGPPTTILRIWSLTAYWLFGEGCWWWWGGSVVDVWVCVVRWDVRCGSGVSG